MSQNFARFLAGIIVILVIFAGGFSYAYLFWNHPYMGGYPDVAVHALNALQTIQSASITAQTMLGNSSPRQFFPFLALETAGLSLVNGLEPLTNLWILQELLPFLYVALFFIIGRNLTGNALGGILSAYLTGVVADLPIFSDFAFSRFISTYTVSFVVFAAVIAFFPHLYRMKNRLLAGIFFFILGTSALFYHHHFGIFRFAALIIVCCTLIILTKYKNQFRSLIFSKTLLATLAIISLFFFATNAYQLQPHLKRYIELGVPSSLYGALFQQTEELSSLVEYPAATPPLKNSTYIIPSPALFFSSPLLSFINIWGVVGAGYALLYWRKRQSSFAPIITLTCIISAVALQTILFALNFVLPARYLREISALLIPCAAFLLLRLMRFLPKFIGPLIISFFLLTSALLWFPKMFAFERSFNTSWDNIRFFAWARTNIPPHAKVLTDPFTFHVLSASVLQAQDPWRKMYDPWNDTYTGIENAETESAKRALMGAESTEKEIELALRALCPDFIVIDPPQTTQFFNLRAPKKWYQYPRLFTVSYDSSGASETRILALKPTPFVCSH